MKYKFSNAIFTQHDILKNVRISMIGDYKKTILFCDELRDNIEDFNSYQKDAITYIEYIARLQLENGIDMYANEKSRLILDGINTIDVFGMKEFVVNNFRTSAYDFGSRSTDTDLSDYIKESILKINSKASLLEFCNEYAGTLIDSYKLYCRREKENYIDDTGIMDSLINPEDRNYLCHIIDLKYAAYDHAFEDALTLVEKETEEADDLPFIFE